MAPGVWGGGGYDVQRFLKRRLTGFAGAPYTGDWLGGCGSWAPQTPAQGQQPESLDQRAARESSSGYADRLDGIGGGDGEVGFFVIFREQRPEIEFGLTGLRLVHQALDVGEGGLVVALSFEDFGFHD